MTIQWFPGHMESARKHIQKNLAVHDVVIEVLDARLPLASSNPMIEELRRFRQRPVLKVLNKADLADPAHTKAWLAYFKQQQDTDAVAICAHKAREVSALIKQCAKLAPHRDDRVKLLRIMIMGIPNVGKSSLLNSLLQRKVSKVGDEPAVTRQSLRFDLNAQTSITDTPGLMWPKIQYDDDGYMLAASHAIGVNALIEEEVALYLLSMLQEYYPDRLTERYNIKFEAQDQHDLLAAIAQKRGCFRKTRNGNEMDLEKAAHIVLNDYRHGKLGRITLETPSSRTIMITRHELAAQQAKEPDHQSVE